MRRDICRRDEDGERIATIHIYAPGDGTLGFVASDPLTTKAISPSPTRAECLEILDGSPDWELHEVGPGSFRALKARPLKYGLLAGRCVTIGGKPGFMLTRYHWDSNEPPILDNCALDAIARRIVDLLNADEATS